MGNRLYVGNLAYSTMDQQLQEAFSEFGEVTSASVVIDRATGQESPTLGATLTRSLLRRIASKAASLPAPIPAGRFELLVRRIAARRAAAWRSL